ncbi:MAG: hypothetical protein V4729_06330 [Pseudomonadota bacterium]
MKASHWAIAALLLVIVAVVVAGRLLSGADSEGQGAIAPGVELRPLSSSQVPTLPVDGVLEPAPMVGTDAPLPPLPESTVDAGVTMQQALAKGDPAAPPVVREAPREAPSAAELADPKAYQRYEARQNQRLYNQYLKAADSEIPRLQADIERARAAGLTPEQLAEGEEKLRRIQAMRDQLQAEKGATPAP